MSCDDVVEVSGALNLGQEVIPGTFENFEVDVVLDLLHAVNHFAANDVTLVENGG